MAYFRTTLNRSFARGKIFGIGDSAEKFCIWKPMVLDSEKHMVLDRAL